MEKKKFDLSSGLKISLPSHFDAPFSVLRHEQLKLKRDQLKGNLLVKLLNVDKSTEKDLANFSLAPSEIMF